MEALTALTSSLPELAKDIKLNLQSVLSDGSLSEQQRLGIALASAFAARNDRLVDALISDAAALGDAVLEDAKAAAALMAMNNVYYRFRHVIGKESYSSMPARLRMTRIANVKTNKLDFELMSLAVSAINNCEMCMRSHEASILHLGASEEQIHDAVRIAAVVHAAAVALELEGVRAG
jgi:lipoyl-dependent peroxiredoxin subunit D